MASKKRAGTKRADETRDLKNRLEETEETLHAIRQHMVDAFVVNRSDGNHVFMLSGADFPYRTMVEGMNEGAMTLLPDGTIFYYNPRFGEILKRNPEQMIGVHFQDLVLPADKVAFLRLLKEADKNGARGEFCLLVSDGNCLPVQLSIYKLDESAEGGISIIATDLSDRKQAEEALRKSENLFRFIVTNSPDSVFSQDLELRYKWIINPAIPLTSEQITGKTDWDLLPAKEAQQVGELKEIVLESGASLRQELRLSPGGTSCWYDVVYQPTFDAQGQVNGLIGYSRDITESVTAKEKIRSLASSLTRAEQEERHRISQILHDDLQQRLFAIKANLSMLTYGKEKDVPGELLVALEQVQDDLLKTILLTRNLSIDLSPAILRDEGLSDAISWLSSQLHEQFGLKVKVKTEENLNRLEEHIRVILFRAVRELLFNIIKHSGTHQAEVNLTQRNGCINISVSDLGSGFDAETVLNDPNPSHGLVVIRDRLGLLGGTMVVNSNAREGTRVIIEMPLEVVPG